jgi:hypothetical protein
MNESKAESNTNLKDLKQKTILELIELFDQAPYTSIEEGTLLAGFSATPIIENDIEQAIVERISSLSSDDLLRYQFVKLKRIYNSGYFDSDNERGEKTKDIRINVLTGYNAEKTNAINIIISSINKELHEKLLNTKHDGTYIDLIHYNAYCYWDPNDTKFICNKSAFLYETDPKNPIKTKKEYLDAIKRNAVIHKRRFKTKLHEAITEIIRNYEQKNRSIFRNFNDIYEAVRQYVDEELQKQQSFIKMKTGTFNHHLACLNKRNGEKNDFGINIYRNAKFTLRVPTTLGGKFYPTTQRMLNALLSVNTTDSKESPNFRFSISNYMTMCGLKDRKETIKNMKRDLDIITQSLYEWKEYGGGGQMNIMDKWEIVRDDVEIRLTQSFWDTFKKYPVGLLSLNSLKINIQKHPNSPHFSFKITQHKHMNYGKPTADTIAVKTLLEGSEIPSYDEVMENYKGMTQRLIIDPFERDLDALQENFSWEYCGKNGIPLTNEEIHNFTYDVFIKSNIKITWAYFPDQTERLEKKQIYIEQAISKKAHQTRRKKKN